MTFSGARAPAVDEATELLVNLRSDTVSEPLGLCLPKSGPEAIKEPPEVTPGSPVLFAFYEAFVGFGNVSGAPGPPALQTNRTAVLLIEAPTDPVEREELYNPGGRGYDLCAIISSMWPRATYFEFGGIAGRAALNSRVVVIRHADYSEKIE